MDDNAHTIINYADRVLHIMVMYKTQRNKTKQNSMYENGLGGGGGGEGGAEEVGRNLSMTCVGHKEPTFMGFLFQ